MPTTAAATRTTIKLVLARAQDLQPFDLTRRSTHDVAYALGTEPGGPISRIHQLNSQRPTVFLDHRFHRVNALEVKHRTLQAGHRLAGGFNRALAG